MNNVKQNSIVVTPQFETKCKTTLEKEFGLVDFRPGQLEAIYALMEEKKTTFAILPTGAVFMSPEMLETWLPALRDMALHGKLAPVVIDECHCISLWGKTFRAAYGKLCVFFTDEAFKLFAVLV